MRIICFWVQQKYGDNYSVANTSTCT